MPCPTDSDLARLIEGAESPSVEAHLARCSECQRKLENQQADERLFNDLQKARRQTPLPMNETGSEYGLESFQRELKSAGYEIVSEIYRGGQAVVFKAIQTATDRMVAVKKLNLTRRFGAEQLLRFEREVEVVTRLKHPNIVTIFDRGTAGGCPFFVMELVEGGTLSDLIDDQTSAIPAGVDGREHLRRVLKLNRKICQAINHAHQLGVIHRDLKPQNVLIDQDGEPRVSDFGLAKLTSSSRHELTDAGQFLGTLAYASPEQVTYSSDQADVRTDVYAVGVMLYEQLTGQLPYAVDERLTETVHNILQTEPKPPTVLNSLLDRDVETILLKALTKDPERRYQSIQQLDRDIELYLAGFPIEARRDSKLYVFKKAMQRNKVLVAASGIILATIIAALGVSLAFWNDAADERDIARIAVKNETKAKKEAEGQSNIANIVAAKGAILSGDVSQAKRRLGNVSANFRDWEWHYWKSRTSQSERTFSHHELFIRDFEILPDGKSVISISGDKEVRAWSIDNPQTAIDPDLGVFARRCRVDSSGGYVGVAGLKQIVILEDQNFTEVHRLQTDCEVTDFLFVPGERKIIYVGTNFDSGVSKLMQWEFDLNRQTTLEGEWRDLKVIAQAPGRKQLFLAGDGLGIYDLVQREYREIKPGAFHSLGVHPNRPLLAAASGWNVIIVDLESMDIVAELDVNQPIYSVDFGVADHSLVVCGQGVQLWDTQTGKKIRNFLGHDQLVVKSRNLQGGKRVITASKDATFKIWNLEEPTNPHTLTHHHKSIRQVDFSPDGKWLASASEDGTVAIFDRDGIVQRVLPHPGPVFSVRFSPDPRILATAGDDARIRLWDLQNGTAQILSGHTDRIHSLCFDQSGRRLVSGARDKTVRVWNLQTQETIQKFEQHGECVHNALFDFSGKWIASRCHNEVKVWDAETGRILMSTEHRISPEDYSLVFHPTRFELAAGTSIVGYGRGFVRVWDPDSGSVKATLEKHFSPINAVDYNPQGTRMVTASNDAIKIWDTDKAQEIVSLDRVHSFVHCVRFSPDGSRVVAGLDGGDIVIWDANTAPGNLPTGRLKKAAE